LQGAWPGIAHRVRPGASNPFLGFRVLAQCLEFALFPFVRPALSRVDEYGSDEDAGSDRRLRIFGLPSHSRPHGLNPELSMGDRHICSPTNRGVIISTFRPDNPLVIFGDKYIPLRSHGSLELG